MGEVRSEKERTEEASQIEWPESPGVYLIRSNVTGAFYIGCSQNIRTRLAGHFRFLHAGYHLNKSICALVQLHGATSFSSEVLELCEIEDLFACEEKHIRLLSPTLNISSPPGSDCLVDEDMTPLNARIPTEVHKRLRVEAINRDATVQELVAAALRSFLGMPEPKGVDAPPKRPKSR